MQPTLGLFFDIRYKLKFEIVVVTKEKSGHAQKITTNTNYRGIQFGCIFLMYRLYTTLYSCIPLSTLISVCYMYM